MSRISVKGPPGSGKIDLIVKGLEAAGKPVAVFLCDQIEDYPPIKSKKGTAFILDNFDKISEEKQNTLLRKIQERNSSNLIFTVETET